MFLNIEEIKNQFNLNLPSELSEEEILCIVNGNYNSNSDDSDILNLIGLYYHKVKQDYEKMEKYYLMAIELGNSTAMNNLACYHQFQTENYEEMEKYYLMAIELGSSTAMNNLACYHQYKTENYQEMEKYYLMAIELGNSTAMNNLACYHQYKTKNYKEMEKYYLMAIELGNELSYKNIMSFKGNDAETFLKINSLNIPDNIVNIQKKYINKEIKFSLKTKCSKHDKFLISLYEDKIELIPKNFIIRSLDKDHYVHNFLLKSEYFINFFSGKFIHQTSIKMNYSGEVTDNFIKWLYTGEIKYPEELIELANEYLFEDLTEFCLIKIRYGDLLDW